MTRRLCATACLMAIVVALPHAQRSPSPIRGRIVAAEDSRALPRARVAVLAGGRNLESVFTDDHGTFSVVSGSDPQLVLSVTKAGYAVQHVTVPVSPSELIVKLPRAVSISGRVADPNGEGAVDVRIVAQRQEVAAGDLTPAQFETVTDDLGEYRLGGLPAGRYEVGAAGTSDPTRLELRQGHVEHERRPARARGSRRCLSGRHRADSGQGQARWIPRSGRPQAEARWAS